MIRSAILAALIACLPLAAAETWVYEAVGTADAGAADGQARTIPAGRTDESHVFSWHLFSLPKGTYTVKVRAKGQTAAASGNLAFRADIQPFGSGKDGQQLSPVTVHGAELASNFKEFTGELVVGGDWLYTYVFCGFQNDLKDASGAAVPVLLDRVTLTLSKPAAAAPAAKTLDTVTIDQPGGTPNDGAVWALLERCRFKLGLGRYEAAVTLRWRDKVHADTVAETSVPQRFRLMLTGEGAGGEVTSGLRAGQALLPSSLRMGVSETIRFPVECLYPDADVRLAINYDNTSFPPVSIERVVVTKLADGSEHEALTRLKISALIPILLPKPGLQVWRIDGLITPRLQTTSVLAGLKAEETIAWLGMAQANPILRGQVPTRWATEGGDAASANTAPGTPEPRPADASPAWVSKVFEDRLMAHDVVVIQDLPLRALTLAQRAALVTFVKAGGGLFVVGGMYGLDRGGWQSSDLLAEILPVTLPATATMQRLAKPESVKRENGAKALSGVTLAEPLVASFLSEAKPKPGAVVELSAGGKPLLVAGTVGKGRVAVLLAPPLGDAPGAYWQAKEWPTCYGKIVTWLALP